MPFLLEPSITLLYEQLAFLFINALLITCKSPHIDSIIYILAMIEYRELSLEVQTIESYVETQKIFE
jgi:hypothetical protein